MGKKVYLRVSFDKTFKNAGLYFAFASMIETDGNYELYNTDKYFVIQPRQIEVYNLIVGEQKTFDGTDIAHIISQWTTNIFDADTKLIITARYNSPNVGADTIYVWFDITGENSANYILPLDYTIKNANIKINPYIAKVYWQRESSYVYNNQDYTSTIKAWYKDIHGNNIYLDLDFGGKALINAGNYTVYASGGDSNYQLSDNVIEIVIEKVKIQVYGLNVAPAKIYDGSDIAVINDAWTTNIIPGTAELIITARYNAKNVNADTIYVTFDITGEGKDNYILPDDYSITNGVKISPKDISISGVTALGRVYAYNNFKVAVVGGQLNGIIGGDDVSFELGEGLLDSDNAGLRRVYVSITLKGADAINYNLIQPEGLTATIMPKAVEVIWEHNEIYVYNGKDQSATVRAYYFDDLGKLIELSVRFDKAFKNKGVYSAEAYMTTLDANYELYSAQRTLEIKPYQAEVYDLVVNKQKIYDGTDIAYINGDWKTNILDSTVKIIITARFNKADVGADEIYITFALTGEGSENYLAPADYSIKSGIKITPCEAAVYWLYDVNYVYNGLDQSSSVEAWIIDVNGKKLNLTIAFDKPFVNAGSYQAEAYTENQNYRLLNNKIVLTINKLQVKVYGLEAVKTKVYDGTAEAEILNSWTTNIIPGTAELIITAQYNTQNVNAEYITVTFTLNDIYGNYIAPEPVRIYGVKILPLKINVSGYKIQKSKEYDGSIDAKITLGKDYSDNILDAEVKLVIKAQYASANSGKNSIIVSFEIINDLYGNYLLPDGFIITDGVEITPKPVIVDWSDLELVYNGTDQKDKIAASFIDIFGKTRRLSLSFEGALKTRANMR